LDFDEFTILHGFVQRLKVAFDSTSQAGKPLDVDQTRQAIQKESTLADLLTEGMLKKVMKTISGKDNPVVTWEQFVRVAAYIANLKAIFSREDPQRSGTIRINQEKFFELVTSTL